MFGQPEQVFYLIRHSSFLLQKIKWRCFFYFECISDMWCDTWSSQFGLGWGMGGFGQHPSSSGTFSPSPSQGYRQALWVCGAFPLWRLRRCPPWNHQFVELLLWNKKTTILPVVKPEGSKSFLLSTEFRATQKVQSWRLFHMYVHWGLFIRNWLPERKYESKQIREFKKVILVSEKYQILDQTKQMLIQSESTCPAGWRVVAFQDPHCFPPNHHLRVLTHQRYFEPRTEHLQIHLGQSQLLHQIAPIFHLWTTLVHWSYRCAPLCQLHRRPPILNRNLPTLNMSEMFDFFLHSVKFTLWMDHLSHCFFMVLARVRNSLKSTFPSSDL